MTSTSFFNHAVRDPGHREPNPLQVVSTGPVAYRLHHYTPSSQSACSPPSNPATSVVAGALRVGIARNPAQFGSKGFVSMSVGPASKLSGFLPLLVAATIGFAPATGERGDPRNRHRHAEYHDQYGDRRCRSEGAWPAREAPAEDRQIQGHPIQAELAERDIRPADHQRHDGQQHPDRHDGRLSADGERRHRAGHQERNPARRHHRLQRGRRRQRHRRPQGLAVLRTRRPQGQERLGAVRLRRARHDADLAAEARTAARFLESGVAVAGSRQHQSAGKAHRRAWRLRAVRRTAAVQGFCPQDL